MRSMHGLSNTPQQPPLPAQSQPISAPLPAQARQPAGREAQPRTPGALSTGSEFVTGAYAASGDPGIDRMLQLERALKLNARSW